MVLRRKIGSSNMSTAMAWQWRSLGLTFVLTLVQVSGSEAVSLFLNHSLRCRSCKRCRAQDLAMLRWFACSTVVPPIWRWSYWACLPRYEIISPPRDFWISSEYTGFCIDLEGGNATNGHKVQTWECADNNENQIWTQDRMSFWTWPEDKFRVPSLSISIVLSFTMSSFYPFCWIPRNFSITSAGRWLSSFRVKTILQS